jgi:rod shape-determining protein MreC
MRQIIYFIKKFRFFLLFLVLEIVAVNFTIQHHSYHNSKFVNSANVISGGFYSKMSSITDFFHLKTDNKILIEENTRLLNLLEQKAILIDTLLIKTDTSYIQKYNYTVAKIINNNFTKRNNFLTINKGENQGVKTDMGVINSRGIIGVIKSTSNNYATVLSILNNLSKINVRLKKSDHFGTMIWDGKSYLNTQIIDIPRQANIKVGDTIITGGKSVIFPEGIPVGVISDINIENNQYQKINIALFNDMSAIGYVQIVENLQKEEQLQLEQISENE